MFQDMFDSLEKGTPPMETFYDGYVVNAIIDACYKSAASKRWEKIELEIWRGSASDAAGRTWTDYDDRHYLVKEEKTPDGKTKLILKNKTTGGIIQKIKD